MSHPRCVQVMDRHAPPLRIDTHRDNKIMQTLLAKNGFQYCGVIRLTNGEPRLAYYRGQSEK